MASERENASFVHFVLGHGLLDSAIDWIKSNLNPDDVFESDTLAQYCEENLRPDEVFSTAELEDWAENNGFTKES